MKSTGHKNRSDIIKSVARKTKINEDTVRIVADAVFAEIVSLLHKDFTISIHRFGVFSMRRFKAHARWDYNTKEMSILSERYLPGFSFSESVRKKLKK